MRSGGGAHGLLGRDHRSRARLRDFDGDVDPSTMSPVISARPIRVAHLDPEWPVSTRSRVAGAPAYCDLMSSGPFTYPLSAAAAFIIRSLLERPDRQTAEEIAGERYPHGQIGAFDARDGLQELGRHGLAEQDADGRWSLTDAGREAAPRRA